MKSKPKNEPDYLRTARVDPALTVSATIGSARGRALAEDAPAIICLVQAFYKAGALRVQLDDLTALREGRLVINVRGPISGPEAKSLLIKQFNHWERRRMSDRTRRGTDA